MSDRPTDEQIQAIIDWPVPLGRMTAPLLAREVQASRKLIADLRALHSAPYPGSEECRCCDSLLPCPTIRLIEGEGT